MNVSEGTVIHDDCDHAQPVGEAGSTAGLRKAKRTPIKNRAQDDWHWLTFALTRLNVPAWTARASC